MNACRDSWKLDTHGAGDRHGPGATGPATVVYRERFGQSDEVVLDYAVAPDGRLLLVAPSEKPTGVQHIVVVLNWDRVIP